MTIHPLSCSDCRKQLVAYIHRELKPAQRRRIGQHLAQCDACYNAYTAQQHIAGDLSSELHLMPGVDRRGLNRMWMGIRSDLKNPRHRRPALRRYSAMLILALSTLGLSWSLGQQTVVLALPAAPTVPLQTVQLPTPTAEQPEATRVASATIPVIPPAETPAVTLETVYLR